MLNFIIHAEMKSVFSCQLQIQRKENFPMIVKQYIKDFENLGFGMFVHFGLYSLLERGEWIKHSGPVADDEYQALAKDFCPDKDWAPNLVASAKKAGCKYITLTTRHHDGYSLYDTCGLNTYDSVHSCGRDLVREFVDACNNEGIIPFFYHTLIDWYEPSFKTDFKKYLKYLRDSVELLCKNYGKIGGIWFDGMWSNPTGDWEEDALYSMMRSYQSEMMIINNTGMGSLGALGHIELDSITFERGKPQPINMLESPKYIASEMCQIFGNYWGYAKNDLDYKSLANIIKDLTDCRKYGSNFLLNVGPKADGSLRLLDRAMFEGIGDWVKLNDEAIRTPKPTGIKIENGENDFMLADGNNYYLFLYDLPLIGDVNSVISRGGTLERHFDFDMSKKVVSVSWLDNDQKLDFTQTEGTLSLNTKPFVYGENLVVRVAKIVTE